jgi:SAM-dependent methyltransferase
MTARQRVIWRQEHVVDVRDAAFSIRTYLEQGDVRALLEQAARIRHARAWDHDSPAGRSARPEPARPRALETRAACEVGSGYGRMTVVLTEFFDEVVGFEREAHFVEEARRLLPAIRFEEVASLTELPASDDAFDCVLTFTVLQHLTDRVLAQTAHEISRIVKPGGHLLMCEETDPSHRGGAVDDPDDTCTIGRPVSKYEELFPAFTLLDTRPRHIEPTYPRPDVGMFMLFVKRSA